MRRREFAWNRWDRQHEEMSLGDFDSWLLLSFGGPEGPDDVMPFLRNVTRGRGVPDERLAVVADQYARFGGRSPINQHNRDLIAAVETELATRGHELPSSFGNRNWDPYLSDTLAELRGAGRRRTLCLVTSAFSSYSGCRQYHDDIERARAEVEGAPRVTRTRVYWDHPGFLRAVADRLSTARADANVHPHTPTLFTAHSIPAAQAAGCDYESQLAEAVALVSDLAELDRGGEVVYQSRSGPPQVPWLEPDIGDRLAELARDGHREVVVVPLGFVSDHMEVMYDLDDQARAIAEDHDLRMVRVPTVGTHPQFVSMLVDLLEETAGLRNDRPSMSVSGPRPDRCAPGCCPAPARPSARGA